MLKSLLNTVTGCKACNKVVKTPTQMFPCEIFEISKSIYFKENLQTGSSKVTLGSGCIGPFFWGVAFKTILT